MTLLIIEYKTMTKITTTLKALTALIFIYLLASILSGINTLNAIQADQRMIQADIRNNSISIDCNALHMNDELAYYKCLYNPQ